MANMVSISGRAVSNHPSESDGGSFRPCRHASAIVPLRLAGEGEWVRIVELRGGKGFQDRMAGMGLRIGGRLEVILNRLDGKFVLGHEGSRLYLGGGMAQKIDVVIEGRRT